jgi:hypothetical protein
MYIISKINPIIMMMLTNFVRVQYMEVSSALQWTVEPNIPNIPEPMIPPLFIAGALFVDEPRPLFAIYTIGIKKDTGPSA